MDAPRRWQVASLATAVAGLGLGSLMVGRSPSVAVEPIDLDTVAVSSTSDEPTFRLPLPDPPEIVTPRVREDQLSPDEAVSADPASPDEPATSTSRERSPEVRELTPPDADDDDADDDDRADDDDPDDDDLDDDDLDPSESVDSPDEDDD
jgi:hypothetical protein